MIKFLFPSLVISASVVFPVSAEAQSDISSLCETEAQRKGLEITEYGATRRYSNSRGALRKIVLYFTAVDNKENEYNTSCTYDLEKREIYIPVNVR